MASKPRDASAPPRRRWYVTLPAGGVVITYAVDEAAALQQCLHVRGVWATQVRAAPSTGKFIQQDARMERRVKRDYRITVGVACPTCGAAAGAPCHRAPLPSSRPHWRRRVAWLDIRWTAGLLLLVVAVLGSVGCGPRCRTQSVPVTWADGSVSAWTMTVCRR